MVVQRLVNAERTLRIQAEAMAAEKAEETERLKGELTVLQVSQKLHHNYMVAVHAYMHVAIFGYMLLPTYDFLFLIDCDAYKCPHMMPQWLTWACLVLHVCVQHPIFWSNTLLAYFELCHATHFHCSLWKPSCPALI